MALGPGCADPYGPKAVRASMGAIFTVPLARASALQELPGELLALERRRRDELRGPPGADRAGLTLLVGSEREGLPPQVLAPATRRRGSTIAGDSLNAAMAATVALYEMTRRPSRVRRVMIERIEELRARGRAGDLRGVLQRELEELRVR